MSAEDIEQPEQSEIEAELRTKVASLEAKLAYLADKKKEDEHIDFESFKIVSMAKQRFMTWLTIGLIALTGFGIFSYTEIKKAVKDTVETHFKTQLDEMSIEYEKRFKKVYLNFKAQSDTSVEKLDLELQSYKNKLPNNNELTASQRKLNQLNIEAKALVNKIKTQASLSQSSSPQMVKTLQQSIEDKVDELKIDLNGQLNQEITAQLSKLQSSQVNINNGYLEIGNILLQWGKGHTSGTKSNSFTPIKYLKPFKDNNVTITASVNDPLFQYGYEVQTTNESAQSFDIRFGNKKNYVNNVGFAYFAIGKKPTP